MHLKEFDKFVQELHEERNKVMEDKGKDYTRNNSDRHHNFKSVALELDVSPVLIWYVYFRKHFDAITTYVKGDSPESEPIRQRFVDLMNYADLGISLIEEERAKNQI